MNRSRNFCALRLGVTALSVALIGFASPARAQEPEDECRPGDELCELKHNDEDEGGTLIEESAPNGAGVDTYAGPGFNNPKPGQHDNGRGGNTFVNDPCLDPPPQPVAASNQRTVQSETEVAVFGKKIVAGYNDSWGFYDNRQGLSGFAYTTDGGNTWIDGGGLPPVGEQDLYAGDPVLVVDKSPRSFTVGGVSRSQPAGVFYYSSIYINPRGIQTLSVNRGQFVSTPVPTTSPTPSISNTRCLNHPELYQIPDPPKGNQERVSWEPPVEAVDLTGTCEQVPNDPPPGTHEECDALDKEWLYVSPLNGELYLTYTRFSLDGETPLELVRSKDGGRTWEGPFIIVPNLLDTFNQATQLVQTSTGRLVVVWNSRTFSLTDGNELSNRIESSISDDDGATWSTRSTVAVVNPQGEPPGYNRGRRSILNAPYLIYGNGQLYVTYFSGKTVLPVPLPPVTTPPTPQAPILSQADIFVSRSVDNGVSWDAPVKANDDPGTSSHVFPTVQVDKQGQVYVGWLDRRNDPNNLLTDAWANVSNNAGVTYGHDQLQSDVATTWFVRRDAAPNFGDYNSSELLGDNQFVMVWSDGRFPAQDPLDPTLISFQRRATPDMIFTIANGLGNGNLK